MDGSSLSTLVEIQRWYFENCDGDWEHQNGLSITTMDNPGWDVKIDLFETILEGMQISEESEGPKTPKPLLPDNLYDENYDWYKIWIDEGTCRRYRAYCSPKRLGYVLERFVVHMRDAEEKLESVHLP